jgi:hypothetical protein
MNSSYLLKKKKKGSWHILKLGVKEIECGSYCAFLLSSFTFVSTPGLHFVCALMIISFNALNCKTLSILPLVC